MSSRAKRKRMRREGGASVFYLTEPDAGGFGTLQLDAPPPTIDTSGTTATGWTVAQRPAEAYRVMPSWRSITAPPRGRSDRRRTERKHRRCLDHADCRATHQLGAACYARRRGWDWFNDARCQCPRCFIGPRRPPPMSWADFQRAVTIAESHMRRAILGPEPEQGTYAAPGSDFIAHAYGAGSLVAQAVQQLLVRDWARWSERHGVPWAPTPAVGFDADASMPRRAAAPVTGQLATYRLAGDHTLRPGDVVCMMGPGTVVPADVGGEPGDLAGIVVGEADAEGRVQVAMSATPPRGGSVTFRYEDGPGVLRVPPEFEVSYVQPNPVWYVDRSAQPAPVVVAEEPRDEYVDQTDALRRLLGPRALAVTEEATSPAPAPAPPGRARAPRARRRRG